MKYNFEQHKFINNPKLQGIPLWDEIAKTWSFFKNNVRKYFLTTDDYITIQGQLTSVNARIDSVESGLIVNQTRLLIGLDGDTTADVTLPVTENMTPFNIEIEDAIPAFSKCLSIQLRCIETLADELESEVSIIMGIGSTSGDDDISTSSDLTTLNDFISDGGNKPVEANTNQSVFITDITPDVNWDTLTAGKWVAIITYIDNN